MAWRKWLVRSLVFSVLGLATLAALLYEAWTNPSAVRRQVLAKLHQEFIGATASLDSARLRLLGGIVVRDLRMARRDELDRGDFLYVPSAVIYHDKEHLLDGTLGLRKIEMDRPHVRIVRERDGRINLSGLLKPPDLKVRVPTLIIRQGTIVIEDRGLAGDNVLLEIKDVSLTVVNDPLSTLVIEGGGQTDALGTVQIHARFHRPTDATSAILELPEVQVGSPLMQRLAGICPDAVRNIRELTGTARIHTTLIYRPDIAEPWTYDVRCELKDGAWQHVDLPIPLRHIQASLRCINGRIPYAKLRAQVGTASRRSVPASVQLDLWNLVWPKKPPRCIEDIVARLEAKIEHLPVKASFFEHLPPACKKIQTTYNPAGPVSLTYAFRRSDAEHWEKHWTIQPEGMSAEFEDFRYPIDGITGKITLDTASDRDDYIRVDLVGRGPNRPLTVRGFIEGDGASEVDLTIAADDVPVDHQLFLALPPKSRELARRFLPSRSRELGLPDHPLEQVQPAGLANIKVFVRRPRGQETFANRYLLTFHDTSLKYDLFPYPLEKVTGVLDIQPDHWECRDFHGSHKGGEIRVNAGSFRVRAAEARAVVPAAGQAPPSDNILPESRGPQQECVQVAIHGKNILLDSEFEQALSPKEGPDRSALRTAWSMLALRGRLSFESIVIDRPEQPQDIDVAVEIKGCSMQPDFFRYAMSDLSAKVRYKQGLVHVKDVRARHGDCRLGLNEAKILLKPEGGFTAWFTDIRGDDLLPDAEFLRALHPSLRRGVEPLQLCKPLDVKTSLVLDEPALPGEPMKIWWDGGVSLKKQVFQAGVEISDVDGVIWCRGHHNGRQIEGLKGNAVLERASILGQPFTGLQGRLEVAPETPDILSLYDLKANLFGGFVGGEARFTFSSPPRYEVKLDALRVKLEEFGKHNQLGPDAQLQGPARASLHLTGEGTDLSGLRGNGRVEVAHGKMYRLPLLLDLLKAFGLRVPDRTAFEQARMIFGIEGPQMRVHELDLIGNAISLRGQGTLNLDGSNLNLDFSADWGHMPQMLPHPVSDFSQAISDQLFKIKLRGKIASPHFEKELIPGVVEPIKKVLRGS
ncbi:MAG TPA: AsmA-like C-terminal region-containing protein [Gemmataceae bacterium]|nr:AsmA-like C-terminal region-containing protein [Gemmataceae bacterium]